MMHPEAMTILIKSHHEYLRALARGDSALDETLHLAAMLRNALGALMIRTGTWLVGHTPHAITQAPRLGMQEP